MFSKKDNKGFTLMEMLIVVAIIAILIAIMIPTFNAQLEKSREAADAANIRAAYAEVMVNYLDSKSTEPKTVELTQEVDGWDNAELGTTLEKLVGDKGTYTGTPKAKGSCIVSVDESGTASIEYSK